MLPAIGIRLQNTVCGMKHLNMLPLQSNAPEDGHNRCPKRVALALEF